MIKQLYFATFDENFAMLDKIHPQLLQPLEDFIDIRNSANPWSRKLNPKSPSNFGIPGINADDVPTC